MEVREELLPVESGEERKGGAEASNNINGDKKTWMSRVRLWTAPLHFHNNADDDTFPFKSVCIIFSDSLFYFFIYYNHFIIN